MDVGCELGDEGSVVVGLVSCCDVCDDSLAKVFSCLVPGGVVSGDIDSCGKVRKVDVIEVMRGNS